MIVWVEQKSPLRLSCLVNCFEKNVHVVLVCCVVFGYHSFYIEMRGEAVSASMLIGVKSHKYHKYLMRELLLMKGDARRR
jgi:hypothetical protein